MKAIKIRVPEKDVIKNLTGHVVQEIMSEKIHELIADHAIKLGYKIVDPNTLCNHVLLGRWRSDEISFRW